MGSFYSWPKLIQWPVAVLLFGVTMVLMGALWDVFASVWLVPAVLLFVPIFFFGTTPLMRLVGVYKYYSPLLLVFGANTKHYDLHNGTNFDYILHMKWADRGIRANRQILAYYLEGLLKIVDEIEAGILPETIKISGTSYFFSERTAQRLGFRLESPDVLYRLNLIFAFIELLWMYSYAHGRWRMPNVFDVKKAVTTGKELVAHKEQLRAMHRYLIGRLG